MTLIGESIRAALDIEGISQAELAYRSGLTTKHVSQLITGKAPLSVDVAIRIQHALPPISAEDLMVAQARAQIRAALESRG